MKKYILFSSFLLGGALLAVQAYSQSDSGQQREEIVIRKKGTFPQKMNIQLNGDKITINGKKPEDIEGNIEVIRKKSSGDEDETYGFNESAPSPHGFFQGNPFPGSRNKALLGVLTTPDDSSDGARIEEVERGTPADSAELQKGDLITRVNNTAIQNSSDLSDAIGRYAPEDKITITYKRGNTVHTAEVTLGRNDNRGSRYGADAPLRPFRFRGPWGSPSSPQPPQGFMKQFRQFHPFMTPQNAGRPRLGMSVEERSDDKGVTVTKVEPGSAAERSGFKPGDILATFAGQKITGIDDVLNALDKNPDSGETHAIVVRNGKERTLTVKIPEVHQKADL